MRKLRRQAAWDLPLFSAAFPFIWSYPPTWHAAAPLWSLCLLRLLPGSDRLRMAWLALDSTVCIVVGSDTNVASLICLQGAECGLWACGQPGSEEIWAIMSWACPGCSLWTSCGMRVWQHPGIPAATARPHIHFKTTGLLYSVLYFWISICYMYLFWQSYFCSLEQPFFGVLLFIASSLHDLMIRKDNSGSGRKLCFSAWINDSIWIASDKVLALGFGKKLFLLLEIVWSMHFEWACCH